MILIGLFTLAVFFAAKMWPSLAYPMWAAFVLLVASLLYADLRTPVNYESLRVSNGTVEYVAFGRLIVVRLEDIAKLEFVREEAMFPDLSGPYIESKWRIQLEDHSWVEIMDEWPHRRQLLHAFRQHLSPFDEGAAKAGLSARGRGNWLCYRADGRSQQDA